MPPFCRIAGKVFPECADRISDFTKMKNEKQLSPYGVPRI
jgi:hypothetical protein